MAVADFDLLRMVVDESLEVGVVAVLGEVPGGAGELSALDEGVFFGGREFFGVGLGQVVVPADAADLVEQAVLFEGLSNIGAGGEAVVAGHDMIVDGALHDNRGGQFGHGGYQQGQDGDDGRKLVGPRELQQAPHDNRVVAFDDFLLFH